MNRLLIPFFTILLVAVSPAIGVAQRIDTRPLKIRIEPAFPNIKWTGWKPVTDQGKPYPLRPIVVTHAGDGSHRLFVAIQQGTIHVFPNKHNVKSTKVFLDIRKKVVYHDKKNEEGLLGVAFHPKFATDRRVFVYYTTTSAPLTSVISSFRVSENDPNKADPNSEVEIMRIKQPFWNHRDHK